MNGREAMEDAARLEAARVYGNYSPEHSSRRDKDVLTEEVLHFSETLGWSVGRVAIRLRMSKEDVRRILAAAA